MKIYLVGGAVRDKLLGVPVTEKDWVVVGATPDDMLRLGFRPVGKDFPVFLHPETHEEYALARTERKIGRGYTGFAFDAVNVTLEDDLKRRDLTINAMAETLEGELIDPYHGKKDLELKILRHVSDAFAEDPVRILRVARFAARYGDKGFQVAPKTNALMQQMVSHGEVNALVAERVWKEWERALTEVRPVEFFKVLAECNALPVLFPKLKMTGRGLQILQKTSANNKNPVVRFAILLHDISDADISALCQQYRVPAEYRDLALLVARYLPQFVQAKQSSAEEIWQLLHAVDALRRDARFQQFLTACEAISAANNAVWLQHCLEAAKKVNINELLTAGFAGQALADKIKALRIQSIEAEKHK